MVKHKVNTFIKESSKQKVLNVPKLNSGDATDVNHQYSLRKNHDKKNKKQNNDSFEHNSKLN